MSGLCKFCGKEGDACRGRQWRAANGWQTCKCGAVGTQFPADGVCSRCHFAHPSTPEFMLR
jgi:hypothetical protein